MSFNIEEFFNSIDVIVEQRLADLSYDTTVIATITDDSDKERGHYVVTDGTIRFDAYVNDMNYKTGDQVRVTIMNGDWSQKKFIVGLYTDDGTGQAVTYIPPLGNVFTTDFSKSTASLNSNTDFTLYANGVETYKPIWGKQITKDSSEYILQANGVYNVITLSSDFQTDLGALSAGGYGLKLELYIQPEVNSTERIMKFVTFDSSEMIGNPYSFVIDSRQDKQFAIAEQGIVTEIILSVYQGVRYDDNNNAIDNSFYMKDGTLLFNSGTDYPIHFKNICIGFGSNLTEIEDKTLKIYTTDSTTYKWNNGAGDETNDKRLGLVWYNKDELDEYVGFSDGIYDPSYDEIQYLKASYADSRLTRNANKGNIANDELSLTLAANIEDSEPYMQNVYKALTTDLAAELQALGRQLTGWPTLQTELNKFINAWGEGGENLALLAATRNTAETAVENLAALYYDVLLHGYKLQNNSYSSETERSEAWNKITFNDYYNEFINAVNTVINQLKAFFNDMEVQTQIGKPMSGYRTVYSNYYNRVRFVLNEIDLNLSNIIHTSTVYGQTKEDYDWLRGFNSRNDEFISYIKDEEYFADFANRYCIYWYRYNEKYNLEYMIPLEESAWNELSAEEKKHSTYAEFIAACEKNNDEYQFGQFLGQNWERVQVDSSANPIVNFGLPEAGDMIDNVQFMRASSPTELLLYRRMEPTTEVEKYQVVLFYNHEMCKSNTLTFTNLQASEIPPEFAVDAADILRIEHDAYSQDHYQAYTQANDLVNIADESRIRQLKCYYEGVLCGDEALAGADIFWYIPTNSTMLTYNRKYLIEKGFITDDVEPDENDNTGKTEYSKNGYVYFSKTIGYTNTPTEVTDSEGNVIYDASGVAITEDHITINEPDKYFFYKIKPYYEAAAQNNTILVEAHIKKGNKTKITTGEIPLTFSTFGTNGTKYTLVMVPNNTQISTLPHSDTNPNPDLTLELSLRDADNKLIPLKTASIVIPENIGEEVEENEFKIATYNLQLSWKTHNYELQNSGLTLTPINEENTLYTITVPNPSFGEINVPYVGILNASVMFNEELNNKDKRQIRLKTFYPVAYSSAVGADYYISGPTTIVYNNQGVVSRLTDEPYRLYQHTLDNGDVEITNCKWELAYFNANGTQITDLTNDIIAYMPKLNQDNTLMPAPMYCALYDDEGKETFVVPVAVCSIGDNVVWTQPIIITQNNYASSTLNDWNGEFEINEANGTILSTMVGAGRKNVDNQFEGVLMGDIERGVNFDTDNASGLGIYGFHQGAQSFHFGIDGKAFLGKAGRGRINFDGDSGTISSASYESQRQEIRDNDGKLIGYENHETAGMLIDLDDGLIDMKGTGVNETVYNPKITKLTEEEYNSLWEEGETHPTYAEYSSTFDQDATSTYYKQARIRLDVKGSTNNNSNNPYFLIHSAGQIDKDKHLMFVGDNEYYLQTDDYKETSFNYNDKAASTDGAGFKLDLKDSLIDAYKLKVTSKNLFLNSTSNGIEPYFVIKHDADLDNNGNPTEKHYKNLIYVGSDNYYLQSANYIPMSTNTNGHMGQGMRLDLAGNGPKITAYNFDLRAGNNGYGKHAIILSDSGSPYLEVNSSYKEATKTLISISKESQYLQSIDYDSTAKTGIRLSLSDKQLKAYSGFTLQAYKGDQYVLLDATATDYPLKVYGSNDKYFQVNWNGALKATGADIQGTINATDGSFNGTITSIKGKIGGWTIGTDTLTGGNVTLNSGGSITIKDESTFHVNNNGDLTCTSATIGGWKVSSGSSGFQNGSFKVTPTGLSFTGTGGSLTVAEDGTTTIENLKVTKTATFTSSCRVRINTAATDNYDLITAGDVWVGGHVGVYTRPDAAYGLSINGKIKIGGNLLFTGDMYVGSEDASHKGLDQTIIFYNGWRKHTLTFSKGVFIGLDGQFDVDEGGIPALQKDAFLTNNGTALEWKQLGKMAFVDDIKKKFNMTLSGTVADKDHSYYVLDKADGGSYTSIGAEKTGTNLGDPVTACKRGSALYVGTFSSSSPISYNGTVVSTYNGTKHTVKGIKCNNTKYEYGEDVTYYKKGTSYTLYQKGSTQTYATYKKAGNLSVSITQSQDITLEPSTQTTTSIDISATGGTVTIS